MTCVERKMMDSPPGGA